MEIGDIQKVANRKRMNTEVEKLREKVARETSKIIKLKAKFWSLRSVLEAKPSARDRIIVHGYCAQALVSGALSIPLTSYSNSEIFLKLRMLHAHLDQFKDNLGAFSEEQGEHFHQDVMDFEQRYQGQYNENMMGYYIGD